MRKLQPSYFNEVEQQLFKKINEKNEALLKRDAKKLQLLLCRLCIEYL
jgi:hypothetical protein